MKIKYEQATPEIRALAAEYNKIKDLSDKKFKKLHVLRENYVRHEQEHNPENITKTAKIRGKTWRVMIDVKNPVITEEMQKLQDETNLLFIEGTTIKKKISDLLGYKP